MLSEVAAFWDKRPCNLFHSDSPVGSLAWSEDVLFRKHYVEKHILAFADFDAWGGKKVLEIGCGLGTASLCFAGAGAEVTAVDLSQVSLRIAKHRSELYRLKGSILFKYADAENLSGYVAPVSPAYDLVYCFGMLHHTQHPHRVLEELKKFVGPGTKVKLMVYNKFSWKALGILLKHGPGKVAKYSEAEQGCPVTYTYSKQGITKLLNEHGFKVDSIKIDHIFPYDVPAYRQYQYKRVWWFRYLPKSWFKYLESKLGWHLLVEASASCL